MDLSKQSSCILLPFIDHFRRHPLLLFQFELIFSEHDWDGTGRNLSFFQNCLNYLFSLQEKP